MTSLLSGSFNSLSLPKWIPASGFDSQSQTPAPFFALGGVYFSSASSPWFSAVPFFVSLSHLGLKGLSFLITFWGSAGYLDLQILHLSLASLGAPEFLYQLLYFSLHSSFFPPTNDNKYLIDINHCAGHEEETNMNLTWALPLGSF